MGVNAQPVLESEAGGLEDGSPPAGSRGRAPGVGLGAKPPEAEPLSGFGGIISTLNPTVKVICAVWKLGL